MATALLTERFAGQIGGVLSCYDGMIAAVAWALLEHGWHAEHGIELSVTLTDSLISNSRLHSPFR